MSRVIENLQLIHSTLELHTESVANTNILKSPKLQKMPSVFKNITISQKLLVKLFF